MLLHEPVGLVWWGGRGSVAGDAGETQPSVRAHGTASWEKLCLPPSATSAFQH